MSELKEDKVPWWDCTKWKPGFWYPMPVGAMWIENIDIYIREGYEIFRQDPDDPENILPAILLSQSAFNFKTAVAICVAHNGENFKELFGEE